MDELLKDMVKFTSDESDRITLLAARKVVEGELTYDDLELYATWKVSKALTDARFQTELESMQAEAEQRIEAARKLNDAAVEGLNLQNGIAAAKLESAKADAKAARAKLERALNGQEK